MCVVAGVWEQKAKPSQAQQKTEIHQLYPINCGNSRHVNNYKARKLKFGMQLDKCHI